MITSEAFESKITLGTTDLENVDIHITYHRRMIKKLYESKVVYSWKTFPNFLIIILFLYKEV